jgi:hypothetical protein
MKNDLTITELSDEQILQEFVKRFRCDGAVLVYLDSDTENGLGRWRTSEGRKWVNNIFSLIKSSDSNTKGLNNKLKILS